MNVCDYCGKLIAGEPYQRPEEVRYKGRDRATKFCNLACAHGEDDDRKENRFQ